MTEAMANMQRASRLEILKARLAAREGKSEYKENCEAIRREIARLENRQP